MVTRRDLWEEAWVVDSENDPGCIKLSASRTVFRMLTEDVKYIT
jgi:hypothetical protein